MVRNGSLSGLEMSFFSAPTTTNAMGAFGWVRTRTGFALRSRIGSVVDAVDVGDAGSFRGISCGMVETTGSAIGSRASAITKWTINDQKDASERAGITSIASSNARSSCRNLLIEASPFTGLCGL
jgi:hypothetical protein